MRKRRVRGDKEGHHTSLGHSIVQYNPESTRDRYSPEIRVDEEQWKDTKRNKGQGRQGTQLIYLSEYCNLMLCSLVSKVSTKAVASGLKDKARSTKHKGAFGCKGNDIDGA